MEANTTAIIDERFRANRFDVVSSIADDLAHEIKNPLNSIIVNLEVLKVRLGKADAVAALERAAVIEEEVRRLHQLIDRVLLLLRPAVDEGSNLPLDSALDELVPIIEAQARLARNEFRYQCEASVFVAVRRDVLKFALLNLVLATHSRLGEGGWLALRCTPDPRSVNLRVEGGDGRDAPADGDAALDTAIATAAALLAGSGARIDRLPAGVSLTLPRSASM